MNTAQTLSAFHSLMESSDAIAKSLQSRITADNAMTPQAVMVRQLGDAVAAMRGACERRIVLVLEACDGMPSGEVAEYGRGELAECARNWTADDNG